MQTVTLNLGNWMIHALYLGEMNGYEDVTSPAGWSINLDEIQTTIGNNGEVMSDVTRNRICVWMSLVGFAKLANAIITDPQLYDNYDAVEMVMDRINAKEGR